MVNSNADANAAITRVNRPYRRLSYKHTQLNKNVLLSSCLRSILSRVVDTAENIFWFSVVSFILALNRFLALPDTPPSLHVHLTYYVLSLHY